MIMKFIFYCCLLYFGSATESSEKCLTGLMTDVQTWVDKDGRLIGVHNGNTIDMSNVTNPGKILKQRMGIFRSTDNRGVEYLSLAKCQLTRVPQIFKNEDEDGRPLHETVKYLTLFGNNFQQEGTPGSDYDYIMNATSAVVMDDSISFPNAVGNMTTWAYGLLTETFTSLLELDLRNCNIQVLLANAFSRMPTLQVLYLSHNHITNVERNAFNGLGNLIHLDLSRNFYYDNPTKSQVINWASMDVLKDLRKLISLDFSHTKISSVNVLQYLSIKFQRLSLCYAGVSRLKTSFFENTSLKFLDLSGNPGVLGDVLSMVGIETTLEVLYADAVSLQNLEVLNKFEKLEILKVSNNEINVISPKLAKTWKNLQVLELDNNRIASWFNPIFSLMVNLRLLSLRSNNINLMTDEMLDDIAVVYYISLGGNFFFCNCHSREFFDVAFMNEIVRTNYKNLQPITDHKNQLHLAANYHKGFDYFNSMIKNRSTVGVNCTMQSCSRESEPKHDNRAGDYLILDYSMDSYYCMVLEDGSVEHFSNLQMCNDRSRDDINDIIRNNNNKLLFLVIPIVLIPGLALGYVFRRPFKYFIITIRNSAMLSMINKMDHVEDGAIFNYDVFVSYCNEDRPWVLDYLLPHVERDCNVSVCLHERDFQVGLPILENIVSCMDRSRSIMLIISQRFLLSQWCQFEMHLAQHRLLETRREDLILILLEDIPRRLRPNTLHYLMLTKTYIIWPQELTEQTVFWKRLKKTIVTQKLKITENDSLV